MSDYPPSDRLTITVRTAEELLYLAYRATANHTEQERSAINELANRLTEARIWSWLERQSRDQLEQKYREAIKRKSTQQAGDSSGDNSCG